MKRTIAVISDIHGNKWALKKVFEDIDNRCIKEIYNLGDCFYGPLDPAGTAELLFERNIQTVRGNEDRIITDISIQSETISFVRENLEPYHIEWLENLDPTLIVDDALLCHGTPSKDNEYLLWKVVNDNNVQKRTKNEVDTILTGKNSNIVLCAHSHVPNEIRLSDNRWVVDVGSVGLQAYTDDLPYNHKMENGSPHARYTILEIENNNFKINRVKLDYEIEKAAQTAEKNGRKDWAGWLRRGIAD